MNVKKIGNHFQFFGKNINFKRKLIRRNDLDSGNQAIFLNRPVQFLNRDSSRSYSVQSNVTNQHKNVNETRIEFNGGLTKLILMLPAKNEFCQFDLKLLNQTVGDLIEQIKSEDKSIEKVLFYSKEGNRLSQNSSLSILITQPFNIKINDILYHVKIPDDLVKKKEINLSLENQKDLEQIRQLVSRLYLHLNIEQYQSEQQQSILKQLEALKSEIEPMEKVKQELAIKCKKHTNRMIWLGLGAMSMQVGIMARLTWFDYSWDIVEPISYFVSYAAVIGVYAYFVLTRKEYDYETASDRIFLRHFHRNASKNRLDVNRYNELKNQIFILENDLNNAKKDYQKNITS